MAVKPVVKNIQPEANAGKNQLAVEGSQVILDGSKSKDRDGKIESYRWQQIIGPITKVALDNPNNIEANFISPQVSHDTILVFKLTVTDDKGSSNSAITAVKVVRNEEVPPVSSMNPPSSSNLQNSSNRIEGLGNSTIERIRP
jgi:chitinase